MPTYTSQPSADNFMQLAAANTNRGSNTNIGVGESNASTGGNNRALIKFDLSSIPSTAIVTTATLTLTPINDLSGNARILRVYRQKRAWVESQSTWNDYATGAGWQTAGGFGSNDCEQTDIGNVSIGADQTLNVGVAITLSASAIQEIIDGIWTNNGFLLKVDTESNDYFDYGSRENATEAYRPKLVIEYTVGGAGHNMTIIGV